MLSQKESMESGCNRSGWAGSAFGPRDGVVAAPVEWLVALPSVTRSTRSVERDSQSFLVGADYTDAKDDPEFTPLDAHQGSYASPAAMPCCSRTASTRSQDQVADPGRQAHRRVSFERISARTARVERHDNGRRPDQAARAERRLVVYQFSIRASSTSVAATTRHRRREQRRRGEQLGPPVDARDYVRVDFSKTSSRPRTTSTRCRCSRLQGSTTRPRVRHPHPEIRTPPVRPRQGTSTSRTSCSRTRR